jgi:catechol 2,3-dioxygenase-like lactoylglutathione lyase family enzyme
MAQSLQVLTLVVRDYDEAIAFFVETLGFDLVEDTLLTPTKRWVRVRPNRAGPTGTSLLLARAVTPDQMARVGDQAGGRVFLFLETDDCRRDYERLAARGLRFLEAPREEPYGTVVVFQDLYGNRWDLIQPRPAHEPRRTGDSLAGVRAGPRIVRPYSPSDYPQWARMRTALWADQTPADMAAWLARTDAATFVAESSPGRLCGFAEVGERAFADGCDTQPVAFLEGWYVGADARRSEIGTALVRAVESWARAEGYRELASDTVLDNVVSQHAHERLGFAEVERAVRYRKRL